MYLDFTYFAKKDSDWLSISSLISMSEKRGGLLAQFEVHLLFRIIYLLLLLYYIIFQTHV